MDTPTDIAPADFAPVAEPTPEPTPEPSQPRSSADIAASVVTEAEATGETPEAPAKAQDPEPTPAELSAAAQFLLKQGHKAKREDGRATWLPLSTVEKMLDRYAGEQLTPHNASRAALERERDEIRGHFNELRAALAGDPAEFLRAIGSQDARYLAFLERQAAQTADEDPEPEPDYPLEGGAKTYSLEGLRKREAWLQRQLAKVVDERLKPLAERDRAEQAQRQEAALLASAQSSIGEASAWPMFGALPADGSLTPFQQEVLGELRKDSEAAAKAGRRPSLSLRGAYLEVFARHQDPEKIRARALEELKSARPAPALSRQGTEPTGATKPKTTADIVRAVLAEAERT